MSSDIVIERFFQNTEGFDFSERDVQEAFQLFRADSNGKAKIELRKLHRVKGEDDHAIVDVQSGDCIVVSCFPHSHERSIAPEGWFNITESELSAEWRKIEWTGLPQFKPSKGEFYCKFVK